MNLPRTSVRNPVAVNLLMMAIIIGGIYCWHTLMRQFFPNGSLDQFHVKVIYPGATPEEVEKDIARRIDRALKDIENVKEIRSQILEGISLTTLVMQFGSSRVKAMSDIRGQLDEIRNELPEDAEDPEVTEVRPMIPAISLAVYGDASEEQVRGVAIKIRDDLIDILKTPNVRISGIRDREIWIQTTPEALEEHGLTFAEGGQRLASSNFDLPGGQLKSTEGNIRVRTLGENKESQKLERIILKSQPDGTSIRVRDIAQVVHTFEDRSNLGRFSGKPACNIFVFQNPDQDALKISGQVKKYIAKNPTFLEGALQVEETTNHANFITQRIDLMVRNALAGFFLVVLALIFFLDIRVAFWVCTGLMTAFLGTFLVMAFLNITINMVTLFGIILVLGLVVDDAIVVGEHIFTKLQQGVPYHKAAVDGANEVAAPVIAAVLTTIAAFMPLAFLRGEMGLFMSILPTVVAAALAVSVLEVFLILPSHLAHPIKKVEDPKGVWVRYYQFIEWKSYVLETWMPGILERILKFSLRWRYPFLATLMMFFMITIALVVARIVPFVFMQKLDAESVMVNVEMVAGTNDQKTLDVLKRVEDEFFKEPEIKNIITILGRTFGMRGAELPPDPATVGQVGVEMLPADVREAKGMRKTHDVIDLVRERTKGIPGVKKITFEVRTGMGEGADLEIRIRGEKLSKIKDAALQIREELEKISAVTSIYDDLSLGKQELRLRLKESARMLGFTTRDLAVQIRHALYGFEIQRIQEDTEEVKVRFILSRESRKELRDLRKLRIQSPTGARVPLEELADLSSTRGYSMLSRVGGKRAITVSVDIDENVGNVSAIAAEFYPFIKKLAKETGLLITYEGTKKENEDSAGSLLTLFPISMVLVYVIIAIVFRSYMQPLVVMLAIPYSFIGVVWGHYLMSYPITFLSMIGAVALAGIVVNDSLILVDFVNRLRRNGMELHEAVIEGSKGRLRAIVLTSVTTVVGLTPLMMERSFQAEYLIPMAISIVFGLTFATVLTLVVLPAIYYILEDIRALGVWLLTGEWSYNMPYDPAYDPEQNSTFGEDI